MLVASEDVFDDEELEEQGGDDHQRDTEGELHVDVPVPHHGRDQRPQHVASKDNGVEPESVLYYHR